MKLLAVMSMLPLAAVAQFGAVATNIIYTSETIEEPAWKRRVVMKNGATGKIMNDGGKVGDAAKSAAAGEAAERAAEIGDAANVAMTNALRKLNAAQANAATNAIALALVIMPETSRTNLTAYVVKTDTAGLVQPTDRPRAEPLCGLSDARPRSDKQGYVDRLAEHRDDHPQRADVGRLPPLHRHPSDMGAGRDVP